VPSGTYRVPVSTDLETRPRSLLRRAPRADVGDLGWNGTSWRRWTGRRWATPVSSLQPELLAREGSPASWPRLPEDRSTRGLVLAVERQVTENAAHVDHQGPHGVVLSYQRRVSHVLHAVMTVLTGGLWALVWLVAALSRSHERVRLEIDPWGHVWAVRLRPRR
jgi:hypothetical protein